MALKIYFKHSTRCPISGAAKMEMDQFLRKNEESGAYTFDYELIDVLANRPRAVEIATQLNIQHESPQIIIVKDDKEVIWTASHRAITVANIKTALQDL